MFEVGNGGEMSKSLFFDTGPFFGILETQNTSGCVIIFERDCKRGEREDRASHG